MNCLVCGYFGGGARPDGVSNYLRFLFENTLEGVEYCVTKNRRQWIQDTLKYDFSKQIKTTNVKAIKQHLGLKHSLKPFGYHVNELLSIQGGGEAEGVDLIFCSQGLVYSDIPQVISLDESIIRPEYALRGIPSHSGNDDLFVDNIQKCILSRTVQRKEFKKILFWSDKAREDMLRIYPQTEDKSTVLYPPVELPERFGASRGGGKVRICFVGLDWLRKGLLILLHVFENLKKKYDNIELVVVTDESFSKIEPNSMVKTFYNLPPKDAFPGIYLDSDIFVLPTRFESFGYSVLEAMACGLPVVTSDVYAMPEIVEDKKTGYLTPYGDMNALEEKLAELIENASLRKKMGEAGRKRVEEKFSMQVFKKELSKVYREALSV